MHEIAFAFRQLTRQPGLSIAAALTLGLGVGASVAVFTLTNAVLLRPLPYPDPDRLLVITRGAAQYFGNTSHRDVRFLREHLRTCAPLTATVSGSGLNVALQGHVSVQQDRLVSHQYFDVLGVRPTWGRAFTAAEDVDVPPPVVILNERFLRAQHIDPAAIVGTEIQLGGRTHTIVGVLAERHTRPFDADIYRPLGADRRGGGQNLEAICRLAPAATPAALSGELAGLDAAARTANLVGANATVAYDSLQRHEWEFGSFRAPLMILMFAVALVLLVAAANTTELLLVRASGRRREIGLRAALGASPRRIARTLITEGMALALLAGVIGLTAAPLLVRGLLAVAPTYYTELAAFTVDRTVLTSALALCAMVGLSVSIPPLIELLRVNLRETLQEEGRSATLGRHTIWMRHLLIGAETAVCAVLLVGALLLLRTFVNLMSVNTGVDSSGVLTARMSIQGPEYDDTARVIRYLEEGIARLEQSPSIEAAAVGASLPAERALNLPATFPDSETPGRIQAINWRYVTPGYFALLKIGHVAGRPIAESDRAGAPPIAVVSEAFAKQVYGGVSQALGRRISVSKQPPREVVGVVADTSGWSLREPARPLMFVPLAQVEPNVMRTAHSYYPPRWIVRSSRDLATARRELESVIRELDPMQPFIEIQSLDSLMINSVAMHRFYMVVLSAFAVFAVLLAAVGIYATYSYAVASRTAEIGVRLALGAAPGHILWRLVGQALLLGGIATTAGLAVAAALTRVLQSLLFQITPTDPSSYAVVGVALMVTVVVAALIPALRAAKIDPLAAIRR